MSRGCQRISTEGLNCLLLIEIKFIFKEIMNILNFQKDSLATTKVMKLTNWKNHCFMCLNQFNEETLKAVSLLKKIYKENLISLQKVG